MEKTYEVIDLFVKDNEKFSYRTVKSYRIALRQFFAYSQKNYDEVIARDIKAWSAQLENELKPSSIRLKLTALKSFYNYCEEEGLIKNNPSLELVYLNQYEWVDLLMKHSPGRCPTFAALNATGVRNSELLEFWRRVINDQ